MAANSIMPATIKTLGVKILEFIVIGLKNILSSKLRQNYKMILTINTYNGNLFALSFIVVLLNGIKKLIKKHLF